MKGVFISDKGTWQSGYSWTDADGVKHTGYRMGQVVHTANGAYRSNIDDNTTNPDTDTTGAWMTWVDLKPVSNAVQSAIAAASNADEKATLAQTAASNANASAENADSKAALISGEIDEIAEKVAEKLLVPRERNFGIQWGMDDAVKTFTVVGNTDLYESFKRWVDTSARPCEIKKDGTDFAYLTNTEGTASSENWLTREDGSASHYASEDKLDYIQCVEQPNINISMTVDDLARTRTVWFNLDDECPNGFRRWFQTPTRLLGRYDITPNADGKTVDCASGTTQGTAVTWSADLMRNRLLATGTLSEQLYWELVVDTWIQTAYYLTADLPSSARGRGIESGNETTARGHVNGGTDTLATPHGAVSGKGYRWMYRENPTDGKQWIWASGTRYNNGTLYLTYSPEKAMKATTLAVSDADETLTTRADCPWVTYMLDIDLFTLPVLNGGSSTTGFCDGSSFGTYTNTVMYVGGYAPNGAICGPFARLSDVHASYAGWYRRGRCAFDR